MVGSDEEEERVTEAEVAEEEEEEETMGEAKVEWAPRVREEGDGEEVAGHAAAGTGADAAGQL